jgi:hypothetical protein
MLQTEAYFIVINYDRETFIVQATEANHIKLFFITYKEDK